MLNLKKFLVDTRGSIYVVAALLIIPMLMIIAATINYANLARFNNDLQNSADAAVLAAAREFSTLKSEQNGSLSKEELETQLKAYAQDFFTANMQSQFGEMDFTFDLNTISGDPHATPPVPDKLQASVDYTYKPVIGGGFDAFDSEGTVIAEVVLGVKTVEIALVLDNSMSMGRNERIQKLETEGTKLVNTIFNSALLSSISDPVKISFVPFAATVNVGTQNQNASWIDTRGYAPQHHENFDWSTYTTVGTLSFPEVNGTVIGVNEEINGNTNWLTRFDVFEMVGEEWAGCVEMRPWPHNVMDTVSDSTGSYRNALRATDADNDGRDDGTSALFVPYFSPDEPDDKYAKEPQNGQNGTVPDIKYVNDKDSYTNDYLYDFQRWIPRQPNRIRNLYTDTHQTNYMHKKRGARQIERTNSVGKYQANFQYKGPIVTGESGPNGFCTMLPLQELTTRKQDILDMLKVMDENLGVGTNIQQGLTWGWRTLTPAEPFTEGRSKTNANNMKSVIMLTDGGNWYDPDANNSANITSYGAWGYARISQSETGNEFMLNPLNQLPTHNRWSEGLDRDSLEDTIYAGDTFIIEHNDTRSVEIDRYEEIMNAHTLQACNNIKKDGISIYAVAFELYRDAAKDMMEACSGSGLKADGSPLIKNGQFYYDVSDGDLATAFESIASEITQLRIVR